MTQTDAILEAILTIITDAAGPYDPAALFIGVATAIVDNGAATVLADVTQATGAMATRVAVTPWSTPTKMVDGRWVTDGPIAVFAPASAAEAQTLVGWFLATASTAGTLKAFGLFAEPYNLMADMSLSVVPRITVDPAGRWSAEIVWNG